MALITYLTTIRFGAGVLAELPEDLDALELRRPLIVTDRGVAAAGLVERLFAALGGRPRIVFDDVPSNPTEAAALQALDLYRAEGCDGVIGFGGGSPIDLAKAVAILATHPGPLAQYAMIDGGVARITDRVAPVIAIPTTAGTGSEVGRGSLMNLADGRKVGLISPYLIPRRAVSDPDLTLGLPSRLTAATGMDALSHCIETFLSPRFNPPADAIALDGAGRIVRHLERAVADGSDREARAELMMGALMGGMTFQKGLGGVHGLSHALGSLKEPSLHHGLLNAVLLPPVLRFNAGHTGDKESRLAAAMGLSPDTDLAGSIEALNTRIGLPPSLAGLGIPDAVVPEIAAKAERDHSTPTNPRPIGAADYERILRDSLK
ncbi:iron-containing alcohol dehydrogenase [Salinarimonas soli]|uniref:Iron-containing alcohol dehydrogenase n=1 Tax=Salinarimonas soli TaxID=1638099 RepID=A0A5B2VC60_9HYPH|nr:iron-containing alcohol dehydrogenase [Salinarimonas soli]KAA2237033.1 iron-containing alcohol dehydrogenase [Salinarimonas soli]